MVERQELRSQQLQAPQESQPGEPNNSDVGTNLAVIFENYYFNKINTTTRENDFYKYIANLPTV